MIKNLSKTCVCVISCATIQAQIERARRQNENGAAKDSPMLRRSIKAPFQGKFPEATLHSLRSDSKPCGVSPAPTFSVSFSMPRILQTQPRYFFKSAPRFK